MKARCPTGILLAGGLLSFAGCSSVTASMSERPCDADGACLDGYSCDAETGLCVTTGDPCADGFRELPCGDELVRSCRDGFWGDCSEPIPGDECIPGELSCGEGERLLGCDDRGFVATQTFCPFGCNDGASPARCNDCEPGTSTCDEGDFVICAADGTVTSRETCASPAGCADVGECDPTLGCQVMPQAPDGTPCDEGAGADGDLCNSACVSGVCTAGADVTCSDGNPCTRAVCEPTHGCEFPPLEAGIPCLSGSGDLCDATCDGAGTCDDTAPLDCDDHNPCTSDHCSGGECFHPPASAGATCRAATGTCDLKEVCDGVSTECPPDLFQAGGYPCGDPTDETCDGADSCDGLGTCLANLAPIGAPCGNQGECAYGDRCDGDGICLDNGAAPAGTPCGDPSDTACTAPDTCDGEGTCLGNHAPAGSLCGDDQETTCDAADSCDGEGSCDANFTAAGTPCGSDRDDTCTDADLCDGYGICDEHNVADDTPCDDLDACNLGESCQVGLCVGGDPPACGDGGDCREGDSCDASGAEGNCDLLGAPEREAMTCDDCPVGTCTICGHGLCLTDGCDGSATATSCTNESCAAQADCEAIAGDCRRIGCAGLSVGSREHQSCADAADGVSFGASLPCRSVNCSDEGEENSSQAIGADCFGTKTGIVGRGHGTISYVFATVSPSGTPFNVWMRNYRHTALDGDEEYGCTLTGVDGGDLSWSFDEGETGAGRHGSPCTTVTNGYCWMAIDGNGDASTYDPVLLDNGEHTLSCDISVGQGINETDENYGYDGILFTNDLSFVPDPKTGTPCGDSDATFSAGACTGVNWGPNKSPYVVPGRCSAVLPEPDGTACWQGGGDTCCGGDCVVGPSGPGSCP